MQDIDSVFIFILNAIMIMMIQLMSNIQSQSSMQPC